MGACHFLLGNQNSQTLPSNGEKKWRKFTFIFLENIGKQWWCNIHFHEATCHLREMKQIMSLKNPKRVLHTLSGKKKKQPFFFISSGKLNKNVSGHLMVHFNVCVCLMTKTSCHLLEAKKQEKKVEIESFFWHCEPKMSIFFYIYKNEVFWISCNLFSVFVGFCFLFSLLFWF